MIQVSTNLLYHPFILPIFILCLAEKCSILLQEHRGNHKKVCTNLTPIPALFRIRSISLQLFFQEINEDRIFHAFVPYLKRIRLVSLLLQDCYINVMEHAHVEVPASYLKVHIFIQRHERN